MPRWANALPDREELLETKRKAIVREAAKVFNRRGSHGATLDDVAERLGVTKAALYRYVQSKQDLLYACHEEAMEIARESMDRGEAEGRNGLEKIQIGMAGYLREMIGAMGVPVLILEENALTGKQAKHIIALRDDFEERMRRLVREGIADGSILPLNPKLAMFMLLGAVHWVTKWYSPEGAWSADEVANALIEMATRGLAAKPSKELTANIHK
ncbi:TetR/AcrR family transcriptional regulator [Bradyrhizobium sp. LHD-71]|uniref:TetR/AcrR family transcriptional regulator n=1 Tax=Bradyrhizobium sp. LHD-71 TaxID=3072141 RepID=UPI00280F2875|nr:TetR/AcrR family transcriptional regulator [Bradyrhizobium sp. LHD-71]MDQ8727467.1 TetR/AcrR family transcriptional regulator [Bradyrhizobium sp. LHD-71]